MSHTLPLGPDGFVSLSSVEKTRCPTATLVVLLLALTMTATHLAQVWQFYLPSGQFKNLHLSLSLLIAFVAMIESTPPDRRWHRSAYLALALVALVPALYIHLEYRTLVEERTFGAAPADIAVGGLLVLLTFVAAWLQWGATIPTIGILGLLYGYFGALMPGDVLFHAGIGFERLVGYASIPNFQGALGSLTELSAGTIFVFMIFAGLLKSTGGIDFIMGAASAIGGRWRSGPAQMAVISSGLMGMISGSTVANVASTGAVTIPMMRRVGFRPTFAGAVEAVASTGGQFTPPVMGLTAFLIAGITGISYTTIALAAIYSALIYYGYLMVAVHQYTLRFGIDAGAAAPDTRLWGLVRRHWHLLLAVAVLIYFLVIQMPPALAALYSVAAIVALEVSRSLWVGRRAPMAALRETFARVVRGFDGGARSGAMLAVIIAVIGIFVDVLVVTGFAQKLSFAMLGLAAGDLWALLVICALACLAFGIGMPTPAAYILVALLGAPALVDLGVPLLAAHLFVFFFANMSALTPPVAVASLVASRIAETSYWRTSFEAVHLGLPGFLLPFIFVARPELLLLQGTPLEQMAVALMALIAVVALCAAIMGFFEGPLALWARVLLVGASVSVLAPGIVSTLAGLAVIAVVLGPRSLHRLMPRTS
jgi:TRAP transporter 4TM/12TM fusion protein